MEKYYKAESDTEITFDMLINAIGEVYGTVFDCYAEFANIKIEKKILFELGFNIGAYIFLMDAYDDYFQDMKKNKFNPIIKMLDYDKIKGNKQQIKEKVNILTQFLIEKIKNCISQLNIQEEANKAIIQNIVTYGINHVYYQITKKRYEERKCKRCRHQSTV